MTDRVLWQTDDGLTQTALAEAAARSNASNYVERGLGLTPDFASDTVDVGNGFAILEDTNEAYFLHADARVDLALPDAAGVNYVYLTHDPSVDDSISIKIESTETSLANPQLLLGTVDTANNTSTELNRDEDIAVEDVQVRGRDLDADDDGVLENADVDGLVNLASADAFSGYPLALADLASPFGLPNITDMDVAGADLVDGTSTIYDATAGQVTESALPATEGGPYVSDETEVSTTNTAYAVEKSFRGVIDSTNLNAPENVVLQGEAYNSNGDTTYIALYIDGTQHIELTTTATGYTLLSGAADISGLADGVHTYELQMKVSASTGYNRLWEVWYK